MEAWVDMPFQYFQILHKWLCWGLNPLPTILEARALPCVTLHPHVYRWTTTLCYSKFCPVPGAFTYPYIIGIDIVRECIPWYRWKTYSGFRIWQYCAITILGGRTRDFYTLRVIHGYILQEDKHKWLARFHLQFTIAGYSFCTQKLRKYWTNTRLLCTHVNAIFIQNPNMAMEIWILKFFLNKFKRNYLSSEHDTHMEKLAGFFGGWLGVHLAKKLTSSPPTPDTCDFLDQSLFPPPPICNLSWKIWGEKQFYIDFDNI